MTATTMPDTEARPMTWEQYHEAGRRRFAEGDAAGAEQAFRGAIAEAEQPGGDPLQMASSLSSLGQLKYQQKDYAQAEDCFRRALELREHALGGDHPTVISSINNLAALYVARGALDDAEPLLQRAMAVTIKRVEASQADLAVNLNNLVRLYVKRGDYARAEPMLTQLLAMKRPLGPEHPEVAAVLVTLAKLRQSMGQPDAAERIWRRVLAVRERTLAPTDLTIAATLDGLAESCGSQGRLTEELELRERSLGIREVTQGPDHPSLPALRVRVEELRQAVPPKVTPPPADMASGGSSATDGSPRRSDGINTAFLNSSFVPNIPVSADQARRSRPGMAMAQQRPSRPPVSTVVPRVSDEVTQLPMPTPADAAPVSAERPVTRSQEIDLSVSPTPTAAPAAPSVVSRRRVEISDSSSRKRSFGLRAERAASESAQPIRVVKQGRGKMIALVVAAVLVLAVIGFATVGRGLLTGLIGDLPAPLSAVLSHKEAPDAAAPGGSPESVVVPASTAPGRAGGSTASHAPAPAVGVVNAPPAGHTTFQTSVTPASSPAKGDAARAKSAAAQAVPSDAQPTVPNVNVDATTRSIDESTKGASQKPKSAAP